MKDEAERLATWLEHYYSPGGQPDKAAALIRAQAARLADYDTRLTAVMPPDMKDWHENSKLEWPEVAAGVITGQREHIAFYGTAIVRMSAEIESRKQEVTFAYMDGFEGGKTEARDATHAEIEELKGLLSDALGNLSEVTDQKNSEIEALKTDALRYRAIRDGLEVDPDNSGIVVSLIDDFGGSTLRGEDADAAIDAAIGETK